MQQLNQNYKYKKSLPEGSDDYKEAIKEIDNISYSIQKLITDIESVQAAYDEFVSRTGKQKPFDVDFSVLDKAEIQIDQFVSKQRQLSKQYKQKYPELFQKYETKYLDRQIDNQTNIKSKAFAGMFNGGNYLSTELRISTNSSTLQKQAQRILDSVAAKIKPITIPIQFVSAYKSEIQEEIKDGESTLSNIQKQYSKALERDIKTIKNQLANVEIRPSVKLEPEELTKIQSQLDKIRFNLTADLNVEKVEIPKKIIGDSVSTIIKQVATGVNENQKTANKKNKTKSKNERNRQIMMRPDIKLPQPFASWSNSL